MCEPDDENPNELSLTPEQRFQILLAELNLLQGRFDKYDQLMFIKRGWLVTIVVALLGTALSVELPGLVLLAAVLPVLFFVLEVLWRSGYWYKYVIRYRYLRDTLNTHEPAKAISLYDLTHHFGNRPSPLEAFAACAIKLEPIVFYGSLVALSLIVCRIV